MNRLIFAPGENANMRWEKIMIICFLFSLSLATQTLIYISRDKRVSKIWLHFINDTRSAGKLLTFRTTDHAKNNPFKPCNNRRPAKDYKSIEEGHIYNMSDAFTLEKTWDDLFN